MMHDITVYSLSCFISSTTYLASSLCLKSTSVLLLIFSNDIYISVCLKLNLKDFDIMGSEVFVEVHYEFPSAVVEEELLLKIAPLPTNIPVKVVENQLKRYISRHFDVSPAETKIIDNSAYLKFDKPKGKKNVILIIKPLL